MTKNISEIELQQNNINKLIELSKENPELKIVPMVDGELGGSEFSYYMGAWGYAEIDEVYHEDERIYFRSDDAEELEEKYFNMLKDNYPSWSDTYLDEQVLEKVNSLEWEKVIVVKIGMP